MTPEQPYAQWNADDLRGALTQAADGEEAWARELLAAGADPNGMPLIMAIQCGELAIVELFIAAGADVDRPWAGTTPLLHAVRSAYPTIVKALVEAGADVQQRDARGHSALDAVGHGSLRATPDEWTTVRRILLAAGAHDQRQAEQR